MQVDAGEYVECIINGNICYAFVPKPLDALLPFYLNEESSRLLDEATELLKQVEVRFKAGGRYAAFEKMIMCRETIYSMSIEFCPAQIENLVETHPERTDFYFAPHIKKYLAALEFIAEGDIGHGFMTKINSMIAEDSPGEYRSVPGYDYFAPGFEDNINFITPPPERIEECMAALESFIETENFHNPMLLAILSYYQFVTVRPFGCASSRTSRLVLMALLVKNGVISSPCFCLSEYMLKKWGLLDKEFFKVRRNGNYENLISLLAEVIYLSAQSTLDLLNKMNGLYEKNMEKIRGLGAAANTTQMIFDYLQSQPLIDKTGTQKALGISYRAVENGISKLLGLGILQLHGKRGKAQIYAYSGYIELLR